MGLDAVRQALTEGGHQVAIITEHPRHWRWVNEFADGLLGPPRYKTHNERGYPGGKVIHLYAAFARGPEMYSYQVLSFSGAVAHFGPAECDELLAVRRR
ncbi:MAG: hypothetical protein ACYC5Y_05110 [Symbiobacteriia bacterium]